MEGFFHVLIILQFAMVRAFAPYDKTKQGPRKSSAKTRKERTSKEWDVRIDCDALYADTICRTLEASNALIQYCLVSGIEQADGQFVEWDKQETNAKAGSWGSKDNHVHIALIFEQELNREQVLATCRGLIGTTDEYATPRNQKFTYAGWYIHHAKTDWKMVAEPAVRLEFGVLPVDNDTPYNRAAIRRLHRKFGCDDTKQREENEKRFASFLND